MKPILDACCGSRMFWFDKFNPNVLFADNRQLDTIFKDGDKVRKLEIKPDTIHDFTAMPYPDNSFKLVIFDPPHLIHGGDNERDARFCFTERFGLITVNEPKVIFWFEKYNGEQK